MGSEEQVLKYFKYEHLPENLQEISRPFCELARAMVKRETYDRTQLLLGLHDLLRAKDCFVRAGIKE